MFSTVSRTGDIIPHFLYGTDHMHRKVSPFTVNTDSVQNRQSLGLWTLFVNESVGGKSSKIRTQTIKTTSARPSPKSRRGRFWGSCFGAESERNQTEMKSEPSALLSGNLSNVLTNCGRGPDSAHVALAHNHDTLSRLHAFWDPVGFCGPKKQTAASPPSTRPSHLRKPDDQRWGGLEAPEMNGWNDRCVKKNKLETGQKAPKADVSKAS